MKKREPIAIPKAYLHKDPYNGTVYGGSFGNFRLYDITDAYQSLHPLFPNGQILRFKDVCFGPYIDFKQISDKKTRSVDDCLVVCDSNNDEILIYDKNAIGKFDWLNNKQEPLFFEPKLCLFAKPKTVREPKYKTKEQSFLETEVFKIIQDMGFDSFISDTENRFFKPLPKINGKTVKESLAADSAFLLKCGLNHYAWYKIYSAEFTFLVSYFQDGQHTYNKILSNTMELIKNLQQDRKLRDQYIKEQYGYTTR